MNSVLITVHPYRNLTKMGLTEQINLVRRYINEGKYDEARDILQTIDHPKAQEWLRKFDEMSPPFFTNQPPTSYDSLTPEEVFHVRERIRKENNDKYFVLGYMVVAGWVGTISGLLSIVSGFDDGRFTPSEGCCMVPIFLLVALWATPAYLSSRKKRQLHR